MAIDMSEVLPFTTSDTGGFVVKFLKYMDGDFYRDKFFFSDVTRYADVIALSAYIGSSYNWQVRLAEMIVIPRLLGLTSKFASGEINLFVKHFLLYHRAGKIPDADWMGVLRLCEPFTFDRAVGDILDGAHGKDRSRPQLATFSNTWKVKMVFGDRILCTFDLNRDCGVCGKPSVHWWRILKGDGNERRLYAAMIFEASAPTRKTFHLLYELRHPPRPILLNPLCESPNCGKKVLKPDIVECPQSNSVWIDVALCVEPSVEIMRKGYALNLTDGTVGDVRAADMTESVRKEMEELESTRTLVKTRTDESTKRVEELANRLASVVREDLAERWKTDFKLRSHRAMKELDRRIETFQKEMEGDAALNGEREWLFYDPLKVTSFEDKPVSPKDMERVFANILGDFDKLEN